MLVTSFHPFEFSFHTIPIRLYVLCMDTSGTHKFNRMVDGFVVINNIICSMINFVIVIHLNLILMFCTKLTDKNYRYDFLVLWYIRF